MKLELDFYADWISALKDVLSNEWGCDISLFSDADIPYVYFDIRNRRPSKKMRRVVLADTFTCPKNLELPFKRLVDRVESGCDLTRSLSKRVSLPNKPDLMLNDWHVHHFHLNEIADGGFKEGSKFLVFAWLVSNKFYVIGIFPHNDWVNQEVVETMHRNWQQELACYKLNYDQECMAYCNKKNLVICEGVDLSRISNDALQEKRRRGGFTPVVTNDGAIYIFSHRIFDVSCFIDDHKYILEWLEKNLIDILKYTELDFKDYGYDGFSDLEAYLEGTTNGYVAIFPKYEIGIQLNLKSEIMVAGFEKRCYGIPDDVVVITKPT